MTRWVIVGGGAVGGSIGARLHAAGRPVVLVARGPHLDAIRRDGLRVRSPDAVRVQRVPVVGRVAEADGDVLVLATKAQHAVEALSGARPLPLVVAQNGVLEAHLRWSAPVYGAMIWAPLSHLEPGTVDEHAAPIPGVVDVGRWTGGSDPLAEALVEDLRAAGFDSRPVDDIAAWKYGKLLTNLGNAVEALCGPVDAAEVLSRLHAEAVACYEAAGIRFVAPEALAERCAAIRLRPIAGERRGGGSSWQSLARGTGNIESDALNGEIVRLGEAHRIPTPVNRRIRDLALDVAARLGAPGSVPPNQILEGP